jgi:hypothetical protein
MPRPPGFPVMESEFLCRIAPLSLVEFIFDFKLLSLERGDQQVIVTEMPRFVVDLAFKLLMPPLERSDVAFSRHDNSLQLFRTP